MAKFIILVTVLAALLLVANARESKQEQQSCKEQLQRVNLKKCGNYIKEKLEEDQEEEEDRVLSFRGIHSLRRNSDRKQLESCCEELNELDSPKCQCRALQKIYEKQSEKLESSDEQDLEEEVKNLRRACGLGPLRGCELRSED
ncbi:conglutin delta 2-like [Gastrolobium bilobum]|uniref:conglutin delta 2-like n=1 Tax=Gastrolobium bilobum TaxID=150636 RepID=UPI002AB2F403|nr:conglutin delta 2-like [Gastrolobium bilobum]